MRKFLKVFLWIFCVLLLGVFIFGLFNRELVSYGWEQFKGQMHIVQNARPTDELLNDPTVSDSIKDKIRFIDRVKKFAIDSLGLKPSKNYTTLYDQHGQPLLWVVTASEPYAIRAYTWKFPVLGNVSYKGYFNKSKAETLEYMLKQKGYDTDLGDVSAWSTLGWFRDPILSNMLKRKEGHLAELIIHEMTHATLYAKSNVDFNENLASFVGEQGAIRFLSSVYGDSSKELREYVYSKDDYDLFTRHMLQGKTMLDSLYASMEQTPEDKKKLLKSALIDSIVQALDTVSFHRKDRYAGIYRDNKPNNAYFLNFQRYDAMKARMKLQMERKFDGDIRKYLTYLKSKYS